jgi:hypothetical protein
MSSAVASKVIAPSPSRNPLIETITTSRRCAGSSRNAAMSLKTTALSGPASEW